MLSAHRRRVRGVVDSATGAFLELGKTTHKTSENAVSKTCPATALRGFMIAAVGAT